MKKAPLFLIPLMLTSCNIYESKFQCPPGEGVRCTPVAQVLDMIIESENGPDAFEKNRDRALILREQVRRSPSPKKAHSPYKHLTLIRDEEGKLLFVKDEGKPVERS